jgi:hypothetical protein
MAFATASAWEIIAPTARASGDPMSDDDTDFYAWTQAQAQTLHPRD